VAAQVADAVVLPREHTSRVSPAIWGFIGVLTGGFLSVLKDLVVERRREFRDRDRELRAENAEARIACRLVGEELDTIAFNFSTLAQLGCTPQREISEDAAFLPMQDWEAHKAVLARLLDDMETWEQLAIVYHNARSLRNRIQMDGPKAPLPQWGEERLAEDAASARALSVALRSAAAGPQSALGVLAARHA